MYIDLMHKTFTQELIVNVSDEVKQTQQHFFVLKLWIKNMWCLISYDIVQCNIYIIKLQRAVFSVFEMVTNESENHCSGRKCVQNKH